MTTNQSKGTIVSTETLFDIASDMEDTLVSFHQIENILSVYDERIESDIKFMKESKDSYVRYFVSRYDALRSMMEVMQANLYTAIEALRLQIDAVYEADRTARPRPLATE